MSPLFAPTSRGPQVLQHRLVMAPLTRCCAHGHVPNDLRLQYCAQRAGASQDAARCPQ